MEGTIGEIRMFAGNFAPKSWAFCQGQLLSIAQNTALFSILGTTYGGNGQTTFALPDFRSRVPVGQGQGPGLSPIDLGEVAGSETNTLTISQLPAHIHSLNASANGPTINTANGNLLASQSRSNGGTMPNVYVANSGAVPMANSAIGVTGGSQPFNNMQPYLGMNFIICLQGIFPSRN
ncbi:phage tail protein [Emticicia sp. C21]|uniref:phage tail protein n=1 Tax=Emticicia sp. C21 TaxID=2302915 RepID=UPI000E355381|nr:tail fiber protein [Emticicia sp. C21]RFS15514.1 phage tail protein [Emticicia sp. C21]